MSQPAAAPPTAVPATWVKQPLAEPIPGYQLLQPLGSGGYGEVWKCRAPGGVHKAIKFVSGSPNLFDPDLGAVDQEFNALQHVKNIRHPFLLSLDRFEVRAGELMLITELADRSLYDLWKDYRVAGQPGIPREELLAYLCEAAEALDLLNLLHDLIHLDVKPQNLFLASGHIKVGDFSLVRQLQDSRPGGPSAVTPIYAAPEVFNGRVALTSDQYSLAIVYQELLTGTLPYAGKSVRQLALQHTQGQPDLSALPPADQPAVRRALAKDPTERFNSCLDFLSALVTGEMPASTPHGGKPTSLVRSFKLLRKLRGGAAGKDTNPDLFVTAPEAPTGWDRAHVTARVGGVTAPVPSTKDPLERYRYVRFLGRGPLGEAWRVAAPDGREQLLKIIYGYGDLDPDYEAQAFRLLQSAHHPHLAAVAVLDAEPGRLVLVTDLVEETLYAKYQACQDRGLVGIPRRELLEWLRVAAQTLDELRDQYSLSHLALNPRNLLCAEQGLLLNEFGLAQLLWAPTGASLGELNPRYAAPELFDAQPSPASDQYSLAVIYQEMATGSHPFHGHTPRQLSSGRWRDRPDLDLLPGPERDVVRRALNANPDRRFPTCAEFLAALSEVADPAGYRRLVAPAHVGPVSAPADAAAAPAAVAPASGASQLVSALVLTAAGDWKLNEERNVRYLLRPGERLVHRCGARLLSGITQCKLEAFRQLWHARLVRQDDGVLVYRIDLPCGFFRKTFSRIPGLEIEIDLMRSQVTGATLTEVVVQITPVDCPKGQGEEALAAYGARILESLRASLQAAPERRDRERLRYDHSLSVAPVYINHALGEPVQGWGKDISHTGIGLYLPLRDPTPVICVDLPAAGPVPAGWVLAQVVRVQPCADGWYEIGAWFLLNDSQTPRPAAAPGW